MAWTTPRTWVSGELVTSAQFNAHLRDNLSALYGGAMAITSQAAGDVIIGASASALGRLAIGANTYLLMSNGSAPTWAAQTSITAVGTITSGIWNAGAVTSSGNVSGLKSIFATTVAGYAGSFTNTNGAADANGIYIKGGSTATEYLLNIVNASDVMQMRLTGVGLLTVSGFGTHTFSASGNAAHRISVTNTNTTTPTATSAEFLVAASNVNGTLYAFADGYSTSGPYVAKAVMLRSDGDGGISIGATHGSGAIRFYSGGTTLRGQFESSGALTVGNFTAGSGAIAGDINLGRSSTSAYLQFGTTLAANIALSGTELSLNSTTQKMSSLGSGTVIATSGVLSISSDERMKDILGPLPYGLAEVVQLQPIRYHWNVASGLPVEPEMGGFGAQQVARWMPLAVSHDSPNGMLGLQDRVILGAVVNGMRELDTTLSGDGGVLAHLTTVDARIAALEQAIAGLKAQRVN